MSPLRRDRDHRLSRGTRRHHSHRCHPQHHLLLSFLLLMHTIKLRQIKRQHLELVLHLQLSVILPALGMSGLVAMLPRMVTWMCSSGCGARILLVLGMRRLVVPLPGKVTWMCSSGCAARILLALGMSGLVSMLLKRVTWMCSSGCAARILLALGMRMLVKSLFIWSLGRAQVVDRQRVPLRCELGWQVSLRKDWIGLNQPSCNTR